MKAVDVDLDEIALDGLVATCELPLDLRRLAVIVPEGDEDCVVVDEDARLGPLGGGLTLPGVELREVRYRRRRLPGLLVDASVDVDDALASRRARDRCMFV